MKKDYLEVEMEIEELKCETWTNWEMDQLEKHDGEVFVEIIMTPIPWHSNNSRRYNIYNNNSYEDENFEEVNIIINCEIVEDGEGFKIIEY